MSDTPSKFAVRAATSIAAFRPANEGIANIIDNAIADALAEQAPNPQVGTCFICGAAIWQKQERMADERGTFHPICGVIQEADKGREEISRLNNALEAAATASLNASKENDRLRRELAEFKAAAFKLTTQASINHVSQLER